MRLRPLLVCLAILCFQGGCRPPAVQQQESYTLPSAATPADSLLQWARTLRNAPGSTLRTQAYGKLIMALYYGRKGAYRQAQNELVSGRALLGEHPDSSLLAAIDLSLGNAAKNLGEYPEALEHYARSLDYYERRADRPAQANVHADIGQTFQLKEDLPQATSHLNTALRLLDSQRASVTYLVSLHTLANIYGMQGRYDSALQLDAAGLAISAKLHLPEQASTFLDNKANCFTALGRYDSAVALYNQCLAIDSVAGNQKQVADTWLNLGLLEQNRRQPRKAVANINRSLLLAGNTGYRRGQLFGWEALIALYRELGQYQDALAASDRYFTLKDSLVNEKKESAIAEWKAIYETEKKDKEISLQQAVIQRKNLLILFLSITLLLGLLAFYLAYRRNKIRKEKAYRESLFAREQQAANDILWAGEKERRRIAAELHDGVGQVLTAALLNLQALGPASVLPEEDARLVEKAAQLVRNGCSEIRQISHNMMPVILLKNGLVFALQEFVNALNQKAFSVHLSVDLPNLRLSESMEVMLYRVIQECVNNVVRHARATRLDIAITHEGDHISVMVEDNGIGLQRHRGNRTGMGMENIRSRIAYLHGTVEWSPAGADGRGTLVAIYVPAG